MYDWQEKSNGNFVYAMGSSGVMTVFEVDGGGWKGIYDGATTKGTYDSPEEAMEAMEAAVLEDRSSLLAEPTGWQQSKDGGYYWISRFGALVVKQARSGKWYISVTGQLIKGVWCDSAVAAMRKAEAIHGVQ